MRRKCRLPGRRNFLLVYNQGRTWANQFLVLKARANGLSYNRFAFAVGRRLGKAVVRNRLRRRLREGVGALPLEGGWDIIIVARRAALAADYRGLRAAAVGLFRRAGLLMAAQPHREPAEPTVGGGEGGRR